MHQHQTTQAAAQPVARRLIRADGQELPLDRPQSIREISGLIGADTLDTVNLRDAAGSVMFVDDLGHPKGLPVNAKATALYHSVCVPGTTHPVRGDVVVVLDSDFGGPL